MFHAGILFTSVGASRESWVSIMSFDPNNTNQLSQKWRPEAKQKGGKSRDTREYDETKLVFHMKADKEAQRQLSAVGRKQNPPKE